MITKSEQFWMVVVQRIWSDGREGPVLEWVVVCHGTQEQQPVKPGWVYVLFCPFFYFSEFFFWLKNDDNDILLPSFATRRREDEGGTSLSVVPFGVASSGSQNRVLLVKESSFIFLCLCGYVRCEYGTRSISHCLSVVHNDSSKWLPWHLFVDECLEILFVRIDMVFLGLSILSFWDYPSLPHILLSSAFSSETEAVTIHPQNPQVFINSIKHTQINHGSFGTCSCRTWASAHDSRQDSWPVSD
jgi:hypothetical protein